MSDASTSVHVPDTSRLYAASSAELASEMAEATVGASLVLVTSSPYCCEADAPAASAHVTVIVCVPTLALTGVPDITPAVVAVIVLGAPEMLYDIESEASTSVHVPDTSRLYEASSAVLASELALATVGASLVLVTVRTYWSVADAPAASAHVTVIVCVPTLALTGVPEITPAVVAVIVLGAPEMLYDIVSEASTSVHVPDASRLYEASSAVLASEIALAAVGASLVFATVMVNVSVTVAVPSLPVITTL